MQYVDKYIINEEGSNVAQVLGIEDSVVSRYARICHGLLEATMKTDELLGKRTTKGAVLVEMARACDPQNEAEYSAFMVCAIKVLDDTPQMDPAMMMLLKMLGGRDSRIGGE